MGCRASIYENASAQPFLCAVLLIFVDILIILLNMANFIKLTSLGLYNVYHINNLKRIACELLLHKETVCHHRYLGCADRYLSQPYLPL